MNEQDSDYDSDHRAQDGSSSEDDNAPQSFPLPEYSLTNCTKKDYEDLHQAVKWLRTSPLTELNWPDDDFPRIVSPFRIGIFGPSHCGTLL